MKNLFVGVGLLFGLAHAQTVQDINSIDAYSNDINAGSARYIGMGGAMGALGGDISSVNQNPAGLGLSIASEANLSIGVPTYKNETKFGNTYKSKESDFLLNHFGASFVFHNNDSAWNRFSIGLNYTQESLDNHIGFTANDKIQFTDDETNTTYKFAGYQDEVAGYKSKLSLNLGSSYADKIYLGLGVNLHEVDYTNYVVFDGDTNGTVYRYELNGTPYTNRATGISVSAGAIGKINDQVRVGLAYHSPTWYTNIEEEFLANLQVNDSIYNYDWYYNQYDRNSNGRVVASAGLVLAKSIALNFDYTYHMNGSTKMKPEQYFTNTNKFIDDNLNNSSEFRVGAEYRIDKFKVRAGYNYIQSPFAELNIDQIDGNGMQSNQNVASLFRGDMNRISFGLGYDFGGFTIDAAYQLQNQKYKYLFGNADYVDYDAGDVLPLSNSNFISDIKENKGLFMLTASWQF